MTDTNSPFDDAPSAWHYYLKALVCCDKDPDKSECEKIADNCRMTNPAKTIPLIHAWLKKKKWGDDSWRLTLTNKGTCALIKTLSELEVNRLCRISSFMPAQYYRSADNMPLSQVYMRFLSSVTCSMEGDETRAVQYAAGLKCDSCWYRKIQSVSLAMLTDPELSRCLYALPEELLSDLFDKYRLDHNDPMGTDKKKVPTQAECEFWTSDKLPAAVRAKANNWFAWNYLFPRYGKPRELMQKVTEGSAEHMMLWAVACIQDGEFSKAALLTQSAVKVAEESKKYFTNPDMNPPFANYIYGLSLYLDRLTLKSHKKMVSLLKIAAVHSYEDQSALDIFCRAGIQAEESILRPESKYTRCPSLIQLLTAMPLLAFRIIKSFECSDAYGAGGILRSYPVLALEYNNIFKPSKVAELTALTGMRPMIPILRDKPQWEKTLDRLLEHCAVPSKTSTKPAAMLQERILYFISTGSQDWDEWDISARLVKSSNGGKTWSKGRQLALATFKNGVSGMTPVDTKMAAAIKMGYIGWKSCFRLYGPDTVRILVGHPFVYDQKENHIDVVEMPLQINVVKEDGKFRIASNIPEGAVSGDTCVVAKTSDKVVTVIPVSDEHRKILTEFSQVEAFPPEAKEKLTQVLEVISTDVPVMSDLLKNSKTLEHFKGDTKITFQITPAGEDMFAVTAVVRPVASSPLVCEPGSGLDCIATVIGGRNVQVDRNIKKEKANFAQIEEAAARLDEYKDGDFAWTLDTIGCLALLDILRSMEKIAAIEWPEGAKLKVSHAPIKFGDIGLSLNSINQWFMLEGKVNLDDKSAMKIDEMLARIRESKGNFIALKGNEFVALEEGLKKQLQMLDKIAAKGKEGMSVSRFNAGQIQALEESGVKIDKDAILQDLTARIREAETLDTQVPATLQADLRDYQTDGLRWMTRLAHWGAGACLADDMGLGKTVQTIAMLVQRAKLGAALVVVPTSVLYNWREELTRFAPGLNQIVFNHEDRAAVMKKLKAGDVVLCTYGVMAGEIDLLKKHEWSTVVLDEAHTIKNRETKMSKAVMQLNAGFRLMLSGTPLQNHLSEIWNLFEFANPGLLGTFQQFTDRFITPIERDQDKDQQRLLKRLLTPFILRRTKAEVLNELPEKTEITVSVELSDEERALYENLRETALINIESGGNGAAIKALAELTKLRQAACHPMLVNPAIKVKSTKTEVFLSLVDELMNNRHRALVFSQFTSHLALIREELDARGIKYLYLDGSTTPAERNRLVEKFQLEDMPLFLISLKAGGTGLNLTAADYVIHLDPWWNPAIENQASDRAYRIGQEKPVTIYRLISTNTIEEKMIKLHQTKRNLADALLDGTNMAHRLNKDEILKLLSLSNDEE